jgi:hypothetical protein
MATYCSKPPLPLVLLFERAGEEPVRIDAADGEKAVLQGVKLLLTRNALRPGDRLTVEAAN